MQFFLNIHMHTKIRVLICVSVFFIASAAMYHRLTTLYRQHTYITTTAQTTLYGQHTNITNNRNLVYTDASAVLARVVKHTRGVKQRHKPYRIYVDGEPGGASRATISSKKYDLILCVEISTTHNIPNVLFTPIVTQGIVTNIQNIHIDHTRSSLRPIDVLYTSSNCNKERDAIVATVRVALERVGLRFEYNGKCSAGSKKGRYTVTRPIHGLPGHAAYDAKMMIAMSRSVDNTTESLDEKLAKPMLYGAIPLYKGTGQRLARVHGFPTSYIDHRNYQSDQHFANTVIELVKDTKRIDAMQTKNTKHKWDKIHHHEANKYIELHPPSWLKDVHNGVITVYMKSKHPEIRETFLYAIQSIFGTVGGTNYTVQWGRRGESDIEIEQCCWG